MKVGDVFIVNGQPMKVVEAWLASGRTPTYRSRRLTSTEWADWQAQTEERLRGN